MTLRLLLAFAAAAALFLALPGIDLWVSSLFGDSAGFPLADAHVLEGLRNAIWSVSALTALGALALWLAWLPLGRQAAVPGRLWGWAAAVYLVGPGLLVNGLLKEHWGRARPAYVFSGEAEFTRPFVIADQCESNCSFVSGEASGAAALAIVLGALLWPAFGPAGRRRMGLLLGSIAGVAALMRVLTGRHFLSDVVVAWFLTALVALGLWHLMRVRPARDALSVPALRADVRALSGLVSRRWRRLVG